MELLLEKLQIRFMIRRDHEEVLKIENASFQYPWDEEVFIKCLRCHTCMVADYRDTVIGFMIYDTHKTRYHVLNFAVHPNWRRQGVGSRLVSRLVNKLSPERKTRINLEVRESNVPAQMFFKGQGFKAVNVLHNFYEDTDEDAYLMQYRLSKKTNFFRRD